MVYVCSFDKLSHGHMPEGVIPFCWSWCFIPDRDPAGVPIFVIRAGDKVRLTGEREGPVLSSQLSRTEDYSVLLRRTLHIITQTAKRKMRPKRSVSFKSRNTTRNGKEKRKKKKKKRETGFFFG